MTLRSALLFASASLFTVACDDTQSSAAARGEGNASAARTGEPLLGDDLPVFEGDDWGSGWDDEVVQELLLDGREVQDVGFLAQLNAFGDPTLYVYDAAAFPDAACAKGFSRQSIPDFAPGEATTNDPIEVPVLRLRYQSKTGAWSGETLTVVDNGETITTEDRVGGVVKVFEAEVPRELGEALVLDATFMEMPAVFFPEGPALSDSNPGQPWHSTTELLDGTAPGPHIGDLLPFAEGPALNLELNGGRTWADLSVDLDVTCSTGR